MSIVVCPNAIVAAIQQQHKFRAQPQWYVVAFDKQTGNPLLSSEAVDKEFVFFMKKR